MGGTWHLRDIIDYQETAWESLLYQAATKRADLLRYFYAINKELPTHYDLVINTDRISTEQAAALVVQAARN